MWTISIRNSLITQKENIKAAWAQVENQLQRRFDLIPNLVKTTKGYAKHESDLFKNIAESRTKLAGARTLSQKVSAANSLEGSLGRLLMIAENYPNLKADRQFIRLSDELAGAENRLAVERRRYNETIRSYNLKVRLFPASIIARRYGFKAAPYLEASTEARTKVPDIEF
jgi:LemA protein